MIHIYPSILIVSNGKLSLMLAELLSTYSVPIDVNVINSDIDEALQVAKDEMKKKSIDVIISAGANASVLEKNIEQVPIIKITPSGFDLLKAIKECSKLEKEVTIMTYLEKINGLEDIKSLFNIKVNQKIFFDKDDALEKLNELKKNGVKHVIGASLINELCKSIHIACIFTYSKESISLAIEKAIQIATSRKQLQIRNRQIQAILDITENGIISIDRNGSITHINKKAGEIFGLINMNTKGESLKRLIKSPIAEKLLNHDTKSEVVKIGSQTTYVNKIPLHVEGEEVGTVLSFFNSEDIREVEREIRVSLHKKGFVTKYKFSDIITNDLNMFNLIEKAKSFSATSSTVLIYGESGVGKELIAQSIHSESKRSKGPFVAINCAAIPEALLESELFGYEEGSFTGANKKGKPGLFELAHEGTIFLDEIGEVSANFQTRLLRVLQDKTVRRIGSDKIIPINVRIICATNKHLLHMVNEKKFREDLYYRINVLSLKVPALRERKSDIFLLISNFLKRESASERASLYNQLLLWEEKFLEHTWPGNIRELENALERFKVIYEKIGTQAFNEEIELFFSPTEKNSDVPASLQIYVDEQKEIINALRKCHGNKTMAAENLGMSRVTLWRKMKKFNLL